MLKRFFRSSRRLFFYSVSLPKVSVTATSSETSAERKRLSEYISQRRFRSEIDLNGRNLKDEDMEIVVQHLIVIKQCKELHLNQNHLTSSGAITIANALYDNTTLEMLFLCLNAIGDAGAQAFATALSNGNSNLQYLFLSSIGLTDLGVKHLSNMLRTNTGLQHLALEANRIGDGGIDVLMDALTHDNTSLKGLYLSNNQGVTNASVDSIIAMLQVNRSLVRLKLSGCNISSSGIRKLRDVKQHRTQLYLAL